jgi:polysaccharide deacetylase 2 family uncharacterized protein YibQ
MTRRRSWLAAALLLLASQTGAGDLVRVAIIIDDLGNQLQAGRRAIGLNGDIAFAFLPGTPLAASLARKAYRDGKEVLLHLPLQADAGEPMTDPVGIRLDMSRVEVSETFARALQSVPHVIGVNSHRGSLLTQHPGHMQWLMDEIKARENLFFIDSYTTHKSIALQIAAEARVTAAKRDVFLDSDASPEMVAREFERMKRLARKRGSAIAIGHPYEATLSLLERELPTLAAAGIELVPVSELVGVPAGAGPLREETVEPPGLAAL